MTDTEAMALIHRALDGVEWSADTLDEIARIVERTGRVIRNSDDYSDD
jgi:hypothetical protein